MIPGRPNLALAGASASRIGQSHWLTSSITAVVVLAAFYVVLLASVRHKSATFDEPGHAFAGVTYWKTGDYRFDPENGNLPQRWFGLALAGLTQTLPGPGSPGWQTADTWTAADRWFNRSGNDVTAILLRGRAAAGLIAVALGVAVWSWSRRLFGAEAGIISLLFYVTNPVILAHGALMTSDMAAALGFVISLRCFSAMLEQPSTPRMFASALAMAALFLTKMSGALILPVVGILLALRFASGLRGKTSGPAETASQRRVVQVLGIGIIAHVLVITFAIWAAFGFRFAAAPPGANQASRFPVPWEALFDRPSPENMLGKLELSPGRRAQIEEIFRAHGASLSQWTHGALDAVGEITRGVLTPDEQERLASELNRPPTGIAARLINFARMHRLLPEGYLYGGAHVWKFSRDRLAYFRGGIRNDGWRTYFPWLFAVKTPLVTFAVMGVAFAAWASGRDRDAVLRAALPLLVLAAVYGTTAILSAINLGLRHLLPLYPALFVCCGAAGRWFGELAQHPRARGLRLATAALLLALVAEAALRFPHYLAYFNGLVRPVEAYLHIVDSSLDWGQELPALRRELATSSPAPRYLAYFGTASPASYQIRATQIFAFLDHDRDQTPLFKILSGPQDDASLMAALRAMPAYDPSLIYPIRVGPDPATLVLKRSSELRLEAGTYYVSASLLPPVHYPHAYGWWSAEHEATYQRLAEITRPLLSDQRQVRAAAVKRFDPETWNRIFREFEEYRFARLAAWLRSRRPDGHVNYAILVFQLSASDLENALNGPAPLGR